MFKKAITAIAIAACFTFLAPTGAGAEATARPVAEVVEGDKAATAAVEQLNAQVASDPAYGAELTAAVTTGDLKALTHLLSSVGDVDSVGHERAVSYTIVILVCDANGCRLITIRIVFILN